MKHLYIIIIFLKKHGKRGLKYGGKLQLHDRRNEFLTPLKNKFIEFYRDGDFNERAMTPVPVSAFPVPFASLSL